MLGWLRSYLFLPAEVTTFERDHLRRMNRIALWFFYGHLPVFMTIAAFNRTGALLAGALTLITLVGPTIAYRTFASPRAVSVTFGFTAMCMGGLLVHFGQGVMQIEMHFYFFVLIALLAVFGNPAVVLIAAVTVALHHLLVFIIYPSSVFNYDASVWAVVVHAGFVVLESIAACFVARSYFDNVIGLERIVANRTRQLDARNRDLRLVLDTVHDGFFTVDADGRVVGERSRILEVWFGKPGDGDTMWDYLGRSDASFAAWMQVGWDSVRDGVLPLELAIDQLPKQIGLGALTLRLEYTPILGDGQLNMMLVDVADVSREVEQASAEAEQRDLFAMFERMMKDRAGFLEFYAEAGTLVGLATAVPAPPVIELKRAVHTLKGNAGVFGAGALAGLCHDIEAQLADEGEAGVALALLAHRWDSLRGKLDILLGERAPLAVELDEEEYQDFLGAVFRNVPRGQLAQRVIDWRLEPTARRLARVAEQARALAQRIHKGPLAIDIQANGQRLDAARWSGFWSAFVHAVRNAVDHGLDPARFGDGRLVLATRSIDGTFVIELTDNGRGIDWDLVAGKAAELGLPHATPAELVEALFHDGLTTRTEATELSGRGVGMGALRAACRQLGGSVELASERGRGTTLRFVFPRSATGATVPPDLAVAS